MNLTNCERLAIDEAHVVGGGVGSLLFAALLGSRADVHVYEKSRHFVGPSTGVRITPESSHVLRVLGVLDKAVKRGVEIRAKRVLSTEGLVLKEFSRQIGPRQRLPEIAMSRTDLLVLLLNHIGTKAHLHVGSYVGLETAVALAEKVQASESALLIGSDGSDSVVRSALLGGAPTYSATEIEFRGIGELRSFADGRTSFEVNDRSRGVSFSATPVSRSLNGAPIRVAWRMSVDSSREQLAIVDLDSLSSVRQISRLWRLSELSLSELFESTRVFNKREKHVGEARYERGATGTAFIGEAGSPGKLWGDQSTTIAALDSLILAESLSTKQSREEALREFERNRHSILTVLDRKSAADQRASSRAATYISSTDRMGGTLSGAGAEYRFARENP